MRKRMYSMIMVFVLVFTSIVSAHPGRTDSNGGHRDNKNVSGLGSYHYHCGGYPAHLHKNGVCPYRSNSTKTTTKKTTTTKTTTKKRSQLEKKVNVIVNGKELTNAYAVQEQGRTLVAIRPIFDALDGTLHWDQSTQTATGQRGNNRLEITIGSHSAKVNNKTVTLDVPGKISNGMTLVPARFIAESLGATVDFDDVRNSVLILE